MLVLPIQQRVDWRKPPLMCLLLIIANIATYLYCSTADDQHWEAAATAYEQADLLEREWPLYEQYLAENGDVGDIAEDSRAFAILVDRAFDKWLRTHWQQQPTAKPATALTTTQLTDWQHEREAVENLRDQNSAIRFGLTPAAITLLTLLSSMFMHGGVSHLLGNMIFLFLFGFSMEAVLGKARFLLIYLLSGISAGLFFCLFNRDSWIPLVGASGAISGLMGMYVAAYGLRRIRFFYYLFFWFGEFTAPALLVLPVWLGKELWEQLTRDSNVAYLAHAGGLLAGSLLTALSVKLFSPTTTPLPETDADEDALLRKKLARIAAYIAKLETDSARRACRSLQQEFPERHEVWEKSWDVIRPHSKEQDFHETAVQIFKRAEEDFMPLSLLRRVLDDYRQLAPTQPALGGLTCTLLASRLLREDQHEQADALLRQALTLRYSNARLLPMLQAMQVYHQRNGNQMAATFYAEKLAERAVAH